ncbi:MAG: penicillin-binding protein 2 [Alphaproteobacteria bacterium]|jgi:penicillin-binding protein 2|nr:penicillin-binding protein 2 [Alphaproteobacteria bacterium]
MSRFNLNDIITRRQFLIGGGKFILFSSLVGNMFYLQIMKSDKYRKLAENNSIQTELIAPSRGKILDRYGNILADNKNSFSAIMIPEQVVNLDLMLLKLKKIIGLTDSDISIIQKEIKRKRKFFPVMIKEYITWEDTAKIEVNSVNLKGVLTQIGEYRYYPLGKMAAHFLGYVGKVSDKELRNDDDPVLSLPGVRVGKNGIEKYYDKQLRGFVGFAETEVNAYGRKIRKLDEKKGESGKDITLSIDSEFQQYTQSIIDKEKSASAVVMDANTGEVYSMASSPSFDPNDFVKRISPGHWKSLINSELAPLTNKVVSGLYPPGSTFKPIVALAALKAGAISTRTRFECPGHMDVGNHRFHCWKKLGHGSVNVIEAMEQSCDVFFYELAKKIKMDEIAKVAFDFGLGELTNIDLTGEKAGLIPTSAWKMARFGERWQLGESIIASIGQGFVQTTPMQLAVMTSRLVNGGRKIYPHIVSKIGSEKYVPPVPEDLGYSKKHLKIILDSMVGVVNNKRGTAYRSRIRSKDMKMGGKTGTSQVKRISMREREDGYEKTTETPWKHRDHALFIGYAPIDNPKYVCCVVVEHGIGGSSVAAPIAKKLLSKIQKK